MPAGKNLENTKWTLVVLNGVSDSISLLSKIPFMQLDSGKVKGFGGCNNYFGSYNKKNNTLHFTGIASTKMFCTHGGEIESALFRVLNNVDSYRINDNHLELLKDSKVLAGFNAE